MCVCGKCWEIYGKCWEIYGKCWEIYGTCWEIHGKSWDSSWKEFGNICEGSFDLAFVAWVSMHWSLQPNLRDHLMNHLIDLLVHMAYGFQQESFKIKCMKSTGIIQSANYYFHSTEVCLLNCECINFLVVLTIQTEA